MGRRAPDCLWKFQATCWIVCARTRAAERATLRHCADLLSRLKIWILGLILSTDCKHQLYSLTYMK